MFGETAWGNQYAYRTTQSGALAPEVLHGGNLHDAADAISSDAEQLGATAAAIIDAHPGSFIDTVLLIDRMHLDLQGRGNRLSGAIIADIRSLLRLDAESTVVVLQPEPQAPGGGPMDDGPGRRPGACATEGCLRRQRPGTMAWISSLVASARTRVQSIDRSSGPRI